MDNTTKVYARQVAPENQESFLFYITKGGEWRWEDDYWKDMSVMPQHGCYDFMTDIVKSVSDVLDAGELADNIDTITNYSKSYISDCCNYSSKTEAINDYLPPQKKNGKKYSSREVKVLCSLIAEYGCKDDTDILCSVLSIVTGEKYTWSSINGCCQGEYREIIYPESKYPTDMIEMFENEFFNLGSEWIVHDEDTDPEDPKDISGYAIYCHGDPEWDEDDIRTEIADVAGCEPKDVVLYKYTGSYSVPCYEAV